MFRARHLLFFLGVFLAHAGCKTEKKPPSVVWLQPTSSPTWTPDAAVPLRFSFTDPAPQNGTSTPATWRVDVGPESGGLWWSTSGTASAPPSADKPDVVDTVSLSWAVLQPPAGSSGPVPLRLTAIVTDGEGGRGADFASASIAVTPLESTGLWHVEPGSPDLLRFFPTLPSADAQSVDLPCGPARGLVHLDGQDVLLVGCADRIVAISTLPAASALWTHNAPLSAQTGELRFLRRVPHPWGTSAWAMAGWPDRIQWVDAQGNIQRTWTLLEDETLIDAGVSALGLIVLARTAAGELRLIRCNPDNAARINSITWTPEAPGSLGPTGAAWLISAQGDPAGLEADGTLRRWFTEPDGQTGLATSETTGSGNVSAAGILEDGRPWIARDQTRLTGTSTVVLGPPAHRIETDRASDVLWILTGPATDGTFQWTLRDAGTGQALETSLPDPTAVDSPGSVAHNRPGPG